MLALTLVSVINLTNFSRLRYYRGLNCRHGNNIALACRLYLLLMQKNH